MNPGVKPFLIAALTLLTASAQAAAAACPAKQGGQPLTTGQVLDGPPQDQAILVPESGGTKAGVDFGDWDVAYVYAAGRRVYLACQYGGGSQPIFMPIELPVKHCTYRGASKKQGVTLSCR